MLQLISCRRDPPSLPTTSQAEGFTPHRWPAVPFAIRTLTLFLIVLMFNVSSPAYSVLTHEEIVDLLWAGQMKPLLLKRYPGLSSDQIKEAHAYAY